MIRLAFALVLPVLLLAGCATQTPEQRAAVCKSTDWGVYGYNDGKLGVPVSQRLDMFADCAKLGQPVDRAAYDNGRPLGLEEYCTVDNGYQVGYAGRPYYKVCPPETEAGFLQGYNQGRKDRPAPPPQVFFGIGTGYYYGDPWFGEAILYRNNVPRGHYHH